VNVKEYIEGELDKHKEKAAELVELLEVLPVNIGELESDSIYLWGSLLVLRDISHKDLGSKLATMTNQSLRFKACGLLRTAVFYDVGPFYKVDLDRPNPKCRMVRVLKPAKEEVISICGDLPEGYELLEELDEPA